MVRLKGAGFVIVYTRGNNKNALFRPAQREFDFLRERVNAFFQPFARKRPFVENSILSLWGDPLILLN